MDGVYMDNDLRKSVDNLCGAINQYRAEEYRRVMKKAQEDRNFEEFIQAMTINRIHHKYSRGPKASKYMINF